MKRIVAAVVFLLTTLLLPLRLPIPMKPSYAFYPTIEVTVTPAETDSITIISHGECIIQGPDTVRARPITGKATFHIGYGKECTVTARANPH